jgi:acyl-coenzyme A thioesterase PaaI-like protein
MASAQEIAHFLATEFPQSKCKVVSVEAQAATVRHDVGFDELRPGGTVSGPVLMSVADVALYVAILGEIGIVPLTVTTNLNINFLRKPAANQAILAKASSEVPGLRATIQLLPSDVEAHFDSERDLL